MNNLYVKALILSVINIVFFAPVFAQVEGNPENWCRNGLFPQESKEYRIAKIKAGKGERVYFFDDAREDCPANKNCRLKSYLIAGDEVIVSRAYGNFACGWFQPKKGGETVGWLPLENLEFTETSALGEMREWFGEWRYYDNSIKIAGGKKSGFLNVTGDAVWQGQGDNVHVGELDNEVEPQKNMLRIDDGDEGGCRVSMWRVAKYLIVADNLRCGGLNVSFSGVYLRKPGR